jgi:spore germination cell wall hydrolase CwlJ-like protein
MINDPRMIPYLNDSTLLLALCVYREARGETYEAKRGVVSVVRNRVAQCPREGFNRTVRENILKPYAFSSFNENDPNINVYPLHTSDTSDRTWQDCLRAAKSLDPDNTAGAVFYFSPPVTEAPHAWGNVIPTVRLGNLHFFKLGDKSRA